MSNSAAGSIGAPSAQSWDFAEDYVLPSESIRAARDEAILAQVAPLSIGVAAALRVLASAANATAVVEIGTSMGASALAFLDGMGGSGVVTSIDVEAENQIPARRLLAEAGYASSRYRLITGRTLDVLPKLRDGAYDIVFVNGDKLEYVEYVAGAYRLLRPGGLLIVNDVLWYDAVADPENEGDEAIIIREALQAITDSESYTEALLPTGNGLLVATKQA